MIIIILGVIWIVLFIISGWDGRPFVFWIGFLIMLFSIITYIKFNNKSIILKSDFIAEKLIDKYVHNHIDETEYYLEYSDDINVLTISNIKNGTIERVVNYTTKQFTNGDVINALQYKYEYDTYNRQVSKEEYNSTFVDRNNKKIIENILSKPKTLDIQF